MMIKSMFKKRYFHVEQVHCTSKKKPIIIKEILTSAINHNFPDLICPAVECSSPSRRMFRYFKPKIKMLMHWTWQNPLFTWLIKDYPHIVPSPIERWRKKTMKWVRPKKKFHYWTAYVYLATVDRSNDPMSSIRFLLYCQFVCAYKNER